MVICLFDYKLVINMFNTFIAWVKNHPYQSIGYSIYLLCFSVVFTLPISYTIIMLGYTYSQVFQSKLYGFLFSVPIVFVGSYLGALIAFVLSRYLFKDFIKDQIRNSTWLFGNFNLINEILKDEGLRIVGLIRLTFAPFGITSYIMGVTGISFWDYAIGNLSYMFMTCSMCFIGCSLFNGVDNLNKVQDSKHSERLTRITFIIEIVMTIFVMMVGGYISKGILEKKLKE